MFPIKCTLHRCQKAPGKLSRMAAISPLVGVGNHQQWSFQPSLRLCAVTNEWDVSTAA
ncbi:hypothetical protein OBV_37270 [Oscillibacter valericigenes Sjm18-20]|nr:hypothetical protein OBV_37270 [Oscillibacter valericigenes Sjm18-20]